MKIVPLVSVIIPFYNRIPKTIRAINSVLNQSYDRFELILVNDASTDSIAPIKELDSNKATNIITLEERSGPAIARNIGVKNSIGRFIAFLDSDDIWHKDKLCKQIKFHQKNRELKISQSLEKWVRNGKLVNPPLKCIPKTPHLFYESLERCMISPSSVMMTRNIFNEFNGFKGHLLVCEDYDLWIRITSKYPVGIINQKLATKFGGNIDQLSRKFISMDRFRIISLIEILAENYRNFDEKKVLATLEVLRKKSNIICIGAKKRDELARLSLYGSINREISLLLDKYSNNQSTLTIQDQLPKILKLVSDAKEKLPEFI